MKTRTLARVVLASVGWLASCLGAALAVTLPLHDGFENVPVGYYPNVNGWRTWYSGVTAYVSNRAAFTGTRSFRLQSNPSWSRCDYVGLDQVPNRLSYQASVLADPVRGREAWVGLAGAVGYQMAFRNHFAIRNETGLAGTVYFKGLGILPPVLLGWFEVGRWVTVRADLDFARQTADLWLDGNLVAEGVPIEPKGFYDPGWGYVVLDRFAAAECNWPGGGTGLIYVDDVSLEEWLLPVVDAVVDIVPDTLNLRSRGQWVTCYIELPEGYSVADIDVTSLLLAEQLPAETRPVAIGDYDLDGAPDLMVKFSRARLALMLAPGDQEISLTGSLLDGTRISGADVLRAIR